LSLAAQERRINIRGIVDGVGDGNDVVDIVGDIKGAFPGEVPRFDGGSVQLQFNPFVSTAGISFDT